MPRTLGGLFGYVVVATVTVVVGTWVYNNVVTRAIAAVRKAA